MLPVIARGITLSGSGSSSGRHRAATRLDEIEAKLPLESDHRQIMTELCAAVAAFLERQNVAYGVKAETLLPLISAQSQERLSTQHGSAPGR